MNKKLTFGQRFLYLLLGFVISMILLVYSFNWEKLPFSFAFMGNDITPYVLAFLIVVLGLLASTLIKSGFKGKREFDS